MIASDTNKLKAKYHFLKGGIFDDKEVIDARIKELKEPKGLLPLYFCHERDILLKHQAFLKYKCCYLQNLKQIQDQGKITKILMRIHKWIDRNIDELYDNA